MALQVNFQFLLYMESALSGAKFQFKVFGNGFRGKNLSSESFFPIDMCKIAIRTIRRYSACGRIPHRKKHLPEHPDSPRCTQLL